MLDHAWKGTLEHKALGTTSAPALFLRPLDLCHEIFHISNISHQNRTQTVMKSDNLQYNTLGCWVDRLIDQASDGPSIILID